MENNHFKKKNIFLSRFAAIGFVFIANVASAQYSWTSKANLTGIVRMGAAAFSIGTKGYVGTGGNFSSVFYNDFWEYNSLTDTWAQKANFGGAARYRATGFSVLSKGYIGTGYNGTNLNDLWEYDPVANTWTQVTGLSAVRLGAVGFTIGNNAYLGTGSFMNDFWLFDASTHTWTQKANFGGNPKLYATGFSIGSKGYLGTGAETGTVGGGTNDFWQYDTTLNSWTQKNNFAGSVRSEAVGFSIGTHGYIATGTTYWGTGALTDLWQYDQVTDSWTQLLNYPGGLIEEAVGFVIGCNAYIGTGFTNDQMTTLKNDLWEFIDSSCSQSALVANFISSDTAFCTETGKCIHFFDQSTGNPTSWQWIFTGAVPDTSNLQNPDSICYSNPGTYPVTLIVSNGTHSDTLAVTPLIIYGTAPPPPTINVTGGDTLISSHASSYQWYFNGSPIAGATDSFYVATQAGTYAVQITDSLGCTSISSGVVFTGIYSYLSEGLKMQIYPNPVKELLIVSYWSSGKEGSIEIYNVLGEKVYSEQLHPDAPTNAKSQIINCKSFISGIYFIKVANEKMNWIGKFVKE